MASWQKAGKFRKLPIIVNARQYKGPSPMTLHTLEGPMRVMPGDWIITGVQGEKYACKDDVFRQTYEPVNESRSEQRPGKRSR